MLKCLKPIDSWICGTTACKDGIKSPKIEFSPTKAAAYHHNIPEILDKYYLPIPCGKCAACQIRKRKDMTVRIAHERSLHENCCFITLTYNDEYLPITDMVEWNKKKSNPCITRGGLIGIETLLPSDLQKFMKRLRRHLEYKPKRVKGVRDHLESGKIRYFAVGEYGGKSHRPHYHILIFGWNPSDLKIHEIRKKYFIYRSSQVEKLWKYGFSTVCNVNYGVAKYCARYVTKKFARLEEDTSLDEKYSCPEFALQSVRHGGIGAPWLEKYFKNIELGFVTVRSNEHFISKCSVPKYYYSKLRKINLPLWEKIRNERIEFVKSSFTSTSFYDDLKRFVEVQRYNDKIALEKEQI